MKKLISKQGFTLIELLIVITIIGILAAAFLPNILSAPARARDASRQGDMNKIVAALEVFNADYGYYPEAATGNGGCINDGLRTGTPDDQALFADYFPSGVPVDPNSEAKIGSICLKGYSYCKGNGDTGNYVLASIAETGIANSDLTHLPIALCDSGAILTGAIGAVTTDPLYVIIN